jgi:hypothetical protein
MPSGTSYKTPSQNDDVYHPNPLRLLPEERVMAPHQGHQNDASAPVSRALLVAHQPHPADASLHAAVSPALTALALYTTLPCAREVPNLHMHQKATADHISIHIQCTGISNSQT